MAVAVTATIRTSFFALIGYLRLTMGATLESEQGSSDRFATGCSPPVRAASMEDERCALIQDLTPASKEFCQCFAGVPLAGADFFGGALEHDPAAAVAAFRAEVDDPVRLGDDVEVVLDDEHRMAGVHQAVQDVDQLLHIGHVQADGGLVQHVEGLWETRLRELAHQLDPLRLAARARRA